MRFALTASQRNFETIQVKAEAIVYILKSQRQHENTE